MTEDNYRPSNNAEGENFRAQTCHRCVTDHAWHVEPDDGGASCPIIVAAMAGEYAYPNPLGPPQWHHDRETGRSWCDAFVGPCACGAPG